MSEKGCTWSPAMTQSLWAEVMDMIRDGAAVGQIQAHMEADPRIGPGGVQVLLNDDRSLEFRFIGKVMP